MTRSRRSNPILTVRRIRGARHAARLVDKGFGAAARTSYIHDSGASLHSIDPATGLPRMPFALPMEMKNRSQWFYAIHKEVYQLLGPEPAPTEADGLWNRDYAIRVCGVRDGTARLRKENGLLFLDHWGGGTLRLREHVPGLYVSATGEILDLTRTPPTYANVRLHQH